MKPHGIARSLTILKKQQRAQNVSRNKQCINTLFCILHALSACHEHRHCTTSSGEVVVKINVATEPHVVRRLGRFRRRHCGGHDAGLQGVGAGQWLALLGSRLLGALVVGSHHRLAIRDSMGVTLFSPAVLAEAAAKHVEDQAQLEQERAAGGEVGRRHELGMQD